MSNSTLQTQYEIVVVGKSSLFTNTEESVIRRVISYPDARVFIRGWFSGEEPPTDRLEVTQLIRKAVAFGRERV